MMMLASTQKLMSWACLVILLLNASMPADAVRRVLDKPAQEADGHTAQLAKAADLLNQLQFATVDHSYGNSDVGSTEFSSESSSLSNVPTATRQGSQLADGNTPRQQTTNSPSSSSSPVGNSPSAASPSGPAVGGSNDWLNVVLSMHNELRKNHQAQPLTWSDSLASPAQAYAGQCVWGHSGTQGQGENLAIGYPTIQAAVQAWVEEEKYYTYGQPNPSNFEAVGHFTQMIWQGTDTVGCGYADCGGRGWYLVCRYTPPGNVQGYFAQNVKPSAS